MTRLLRLAIVSVLAIVTAVLGTRGSAVAAETAYNSKRQYLSADPQAQRRRRACNAASTWPRAPTNGASS